MGTQNGLPYWNQGPKPVVPIPGGLILTHQFTRLESRLLSEARELDRAGEGASIRPSRCVC